MNALPTPEVPNAFVQYEQMPRQFEALPLTASHDHYFALQIGTITVWIVIFDHHAVDCSSRN